MKWVVKGHLLRCKRASFTHQKGMFCNAKGRLLHSKRACIVWQLWIFLTKRGGEGRCKGFSIGCFWLVMDIPLAVVEVFKWSSFVKWWGYMTTWECMPWQSLLCRFVFDYAKKVGEKVGRYRIKTISLWRKDDFRNEELTRQTEGSKASSVLQNGLFSFVMNGY